MSLLVQPRLVNRPDGDPGVYLDFNFGRRAMLFDLGDLSPLTPRELLRVSHAFVSHAHMDHVAGFDHLLRLRLHRPRPLTVAGPPGFLQQVESRFRAFSWNLLDETSVDFRLAVLEFDGTRVTAGAEFRAREAFRRRDLVTSGLADGLVLAEENLSVEAVALDHGIPSLAFALQEGVQVNVHRNVLDELGLPVGPWLDEAKRSARSDLPDGHRIDVPGQGTIPLGLLRSRAFRIRPGQRVVYVTDAADTAVNRERIVRLAAGADSLFIEMGFMERDRELAEATSHLTARAAGEIARAAEVRRVVGFHQSARYAETPDAPRAELEAATSGEEPDVVVHEPAARRRSIAVEEEPAWLRRWRRKPLDPAAALARFERLPALEPHEMLGEWRGVGLPTHHPFDGALEALGWYGKQFEDADRVQPLLFGTPPRIFAVNPALLPVGLALRWPRLARSRAARALLPFLSTRRPAARLRKLEFGGTASAAMLYDQQPIIDHFRRAGPRHVLGLMEMRGAAPFFFLLARGD